jgi:aryl-alcohol dehydrogenase-like predicted oxidoreductase
MEYRTLGRTGLEVSAMGLGTGGPSLFGQQAGVPGGEAIKLVRQALDSGVNFFDTSPQYRESETLLGQALKGVRREEYFVATKFVYERDAGSVGPGELVTPAQVESSVEQSLKRLGVETIDILQFHGLKPGNYRAAMDALGPTVERLREQGKFRFFGVSENYRQDHEHEMLALALADDVFDTVMVGYNLLGPAPEQDILPACQAQNVGAICMVAVRRSLSQPDHLRRRLREAVQRGEIETRELGDEDAPLGWLVQGHVESLPAAGYKYVAAHPALGTILTGTASRTHLAANLRAILGPPLTDEHMARLRRIFGRVRAPLGE